MKNRQKAKRQYSKALLKSDYIGSQLLQEFNDLVDLFLHFGKNKKTSNTSTATPKTKNRGRKKKKKKKPGNHTHVFPTHIIFENLIKKLITHVRKLVAGLVKGQGKNVMASG